MRTLHHQRKGPGRKMDKQKQNGMRIAFVMQKNKHWLTMTHQNRSIGRFGFGCVGQGLYDVLNNSQGLKANIARICVKNKDKKRKIDISYFTWNKNDILREKKHN